MLFCSMTARVLGGYTVKVIPHLTANSCWSGDQTLRSNRGFCTKQSNGLVFPGRAKCFSRLQHTTHAGPAARGTLFIPCTSDPGLYFGLGRACLSVHESLERAVQPGTSVQPAAWLREPGDSSSSLLRPSLRVLKAWTSADMLSF